MQHGTDLQAGTQTAQDGSQNVEHVTDGFIPVNRHARGGTQTPSKETACMRVQNSFELLQDPHGGNINPREAPLHGPSL